MWTWIQNHLPSALGSGFASEMPFDGPLLWNKRLDTLSTLFDLRPFRVRCVGLGLDDAVWIATGNSLVVLNQQAGQKNFEFDAAVTCFQHGESGHILVCTTKSIGLFRLDAATGKMAQEWLEPQPSSHCITHAVVAPGGFLLVAQPFKHLVEDWVTLWGDDRRSSKVYFLGTDQPHKLRLAISNLGPTGGLAWSADRQALLLSLPLEHRVRAYAADGFREIRSPLVNLPGYPGSIVTVAGSTQYWISLLTLRNSLCDLVWSKHRLRHAMTKGLAPGDRFIPLIETDKRQLPCRYWQELDHRKTNVRTGTYGLLLGLDANFAVIDSLHSQRGGNCHGVSRLLVRKNGDVLLYSEQSKALKVMAI